MKNVQGLVKKVVRREGMNNASMELWNETLRLSKKAALTRKDLFVGTTSYHIYSVTMTKDSEGVKQVKTSAVMLGENTFLAKSKVEAVNLQTTGFKALFGEDKRFTKDFMTLTADRDILEGFRGKSLFVSHSTGRVLIDANTVKKTTAGLKKAFTDLTTGKEVVAMPKDTVEYRFFIYTTGGIKKGQSLWYRVREGVTPNTLLDNNLAGIMRNVSNKLVQAQATKFASRPGLGWTKGNTTVVLDSIAVFNGEFDKVANTSDGQVYMPATVAMDITKTRTVEEAIGIIMQARISGVYKFQIIVIDDILFEEKLVELANREGGSISILGDENVYPQLLLDDNAVKAKINPEKIMLTLMSFGKVSAGKLSKQAIEKVLIAAAEKGKLEDVVKYLEDSAISMIADKVKDIIVAEASEAKINVDYILDVLSAKNPKNPIVMNRKYKDTVKAIRKIIDKLAIELKDANGNDLIVNAVVAGDITATFGLNLIPEDKIVFGKYSKKLYEVGNEFGRDSEEYKELAAQYKEFVAFKYPSMYIKEYAAGEVMDLAELFVLIDESKASDRLKAALRRYFINMSDATIMFPASRAIFDTCAGMDTDFDKISVCFDRTIVELLKGHQEVLSISATVKEDKEVVKGINSSFAKALADRNIESANAGEKIQKKFDTTSEEFFYDMYMLQSEFEGNIGVITFYNNRVVAMLLECLQGNFGPAKHFLQECLKETKGKEGKYEIDQDVVNPAYVDKMVNKMQEIEWNNENIIAFLTDCSKVFRLYQETTIDAAKTGIYLAIKLTVRTVVVASLLEVKQIVDEETGRIVLKRAEYKEKEIKFYITDEATGKKLLDRKMKTIFLLDRMARIQDKLMSIVNEDLAAVIEQHSDLFQYTPEQCSDFVNYIERVKRVKGGSELIAMLYTIRSIYNDKTSHYMTSLGEINMNDDDSDAKVEVARATYQAELETLSNSVRRVMDKIKYANDPNEDAKFKGAIILGIGATNPSDLKVNAKNCSRFAYNLLPEYTYAYLVGGKSYEAVGTVLQRGQEVEGSVELVNGVSANGLITKERYTGTVMFDGEKVAVERTFEDVEVDSKMFTLVVPKSVDNKFKTTLEESVGVDSLIKVSNGVVSFDIDCTNENGKYVTIGKSVMFDGKNNAEFYINQVYTTNILVNTHAGTDKKAFWEETDCYVLTLELA